MIDGFRDISGESPYPKFIENEPDLIAVWSTPRGSGWSDTPFSSAFVRRRPDHWDVELVPANGRGQEANYFAHAFSQCISLHVADTETGVSPHRFVDLR